MKTMLRNLLAVLAIVGWASAAPAEVLFTETFSYPNGNLATAPPEGGVSGGLWTRAVNTSIVSPNVAVSDGKVTLHQRPSPGGVVLNSGEDVYRGFSAPTPGQTIYAGFDVSTSGSNASVEFVWLRNALFVAPPVSGGDFTFGIGYIFNTNPVISWPGGLSFNTTYRTVLSYEPATGISKLWVNPVDQLSTNVSFTNSASGGVSSVVLLQGFTGGQWSTPSSVQVIDNIVVGTSFNDVLAVPASALGDYNGDSQVDGSDFLNWQRGESPNPLSAADLTAWKANFGSELLVAASQPVPEPAGWLLALAGAAITRLRGRPASAINPFRVLFDVFFGDRYRSSSCA